MLPPLSSTLFPYTTLFRSQERCHRGNVEITYPSSWQPSRNLLQRSEEHTSELQSRRELVCRLLLEKKNISDYFLSIEHMILFYPPAEHVAADDSLFDIMLH